MSMRHRSPNTQGNVPTGYPSVSSVGRFALGDSGVLLWGYFGVPLEYPAKHTHTNTPKGPRVLF